MKKVTFGEAYEIVSAADLVVVNEDFPMQKGTFSVQKGIALEFDMGHDSMWVDIKDNAEVEMYENCLEFVDTEGNKLMVEVYELKKLM